jgi:hypothetical protein
MEDLIKQLIELLEDGSKKDLCKPNKNGFTWYLDSYHHFHSNWIIDFFLNYFTFFGSRNSEVEAFKIAILDLIIKSNIKKYLFYIDDPNNEKNLNGAWVSVAFQTWEIPFKVDAGELMGFLDAGNWTIYISDKPVQHSYPGFADSSTRTIKDVLDKYSIKTMIDAGPDNFEWHLSINPVLLKNVDYGEANSV